MNGRRFLLGYRRRLLVSQWLGIGLLLLVAWTVWKQSVRASSLRWNTGQAVFVRRVVDGDTLLLENGARVRLLGVDTPETKHPERGVEPYGIEAYEKTRGLVEQRDVTLLFDRERRDQYGRLLAYVELADGSLLNMELVRAGYSRALVTFPLATRYKKLLLAAEEEAKGSGLGIWSLQELTQDEK